jgi:hypothetical protein
MTSRNKGEIKKFLESNENEHNLPEPLVYSKGSAKRKVYSFEYFCHKIREIPNK